MPFIPHSTQEIQEMLTAIGVQSTDALFDEIPKNLFCKDLAKPGIGLTEMEATRLMQTHAEKDKTKLCFIGAGAYEHHIPAAVWDITSRGEFLTAYTPYQPEASQGTLQLLYEYQTMIASLTGMDVSNASMYDGASALAEAVLMSVRLHKGNHILLPKTLSPFYRETVKTIVTQQNIAITEIPYDANGLIDFNFLQTVNIDRVAALVIPQPNFFGHLENVDQLTDWAKDKNILSIAVVNPTAMALLKEPGQWGQNGADIACGDGQPLGIPLASGGPYFGFLCCKKAYVRQMPGRIVGRTVDQNGAQGFVLTLQAREQHIRRSKATSNICTNQSLLVTAGTIYMSLLGPEGLKRVAAACHTNTKKLAKLISAIPDTEIIFNSPYFHEIVVRLPKCARTVLNALSKEGIQGGFDLTPYYPELENCILVCATETKTDEDLQQFAGAIRRALAQDRVTI